jgi:uncharacterized damage-inducible protein DinB
MSKIAEPMLNEFRQEAATTKRVLERVPQDKLTWKPHAKSMSLGQLALHVASVPGGIAKISQMTEFDVSQARPAGEAKNTQEILSAFDESVRGVEETLNGLNEQSAMVPWRMTRNGQEIFSIPRIGLLRSIMLNHWYHHRGQLSVYLRLLDVPVPAIYGPSADENPFG